MKKWLSLILCLMMLAGLAACGETEAPGTDSVTAGTSDASGSSDTAGSSDSEEEEWAPLELMENKVIVTDYRQGRVVVYDLDLVGEDGNLDLAEVWSLENHYSASIKYREDTIYGDVVLITNGGGPMIFDFATKELIWSAPGKAGSNPHSIEILPSGNIVTASSTDGLVRIFNAAACVNDGATAKFTTQNLPGAHGVLWDPKYEVVWAIGDDDLVAYRVVDGQNGEQTLVPMQGMGAKLPKAGGHDLSADLLDDDFLWCTSQGVYHFDKENNEWEEKYDNYAKFKSKNGVKGFGNNLNKNYIFTQMKGDDKEWLATGNPDWSTDTIYYAYWKTENFLYIKECVSAKSAFYKARVFYGKYQ